MVQPDDEPDDAEAAGEDEGALPAEVDGDPGNGERDEDGSDAGAAVEEAGGEGAFALGEPFGDGLDGGGEVAGFAEAEEEAGRCRKRARSGRRQWLMAARLQRPMVRAVAEA